MKYLNFDFCLKYFTILGQGCLGLCVTFLCQCATPGGWLTPYCCVITPRMNRRWPNSNIAFRNSDRWPSPPRMRDQRRREAGASARTWSSSASPWSTSRVPNSLSEVSSALIGTRAPVSSVYLFVTTLYIYVILYTFTLCIHVGSPISFEFTFL